MSEARHRVLIVGGGIGGLAAALALRRAGYGVDIAERAAQFSEIGAGIQLSPNALRILAELGLADALGAVASEPAALEVRSGLNGRLLSAIRRDTLRQRYGAPYLVVHRAALQSVLVRAAEADDAIRIRLSSEVTAFDEDGGGVRARLAGPSDLGARSFAALIGADGVRSAVRATMSPARAPRLAGRTAWRALLPVGAAAASVRSDAVVAWLGPRAHLVCYPVSAGAEINLVAIVEDGADDAGWATPGEASQLVRRFSDWAPAIRDLIAAVEDWRVFTLRSVDAEGLWVRGRVALLGDAAHAMMPFVAQGAAMAIEDAWVLAAALRDAGDVPAALRLYEGRRRERVIAVAAAAARTGARYHYSGAMAAARNLALRLGGERLVLRELDWIFRWAA